MRQFTATAALRCFLEQCRINGGDIGFVPTMGALHAGHRSLIERAKQENSWVVVSIFVNPLQFGPNEDFDQYPRTLAADRALCEQIGVDVIFTPAPDDLGVLAPSPTQVMPPASMQSGLCGASRPGHFDGVATIVTKLLNIVQPTRAYFGQKDAQQLAILQRVVQDLNINTTLVPCPIVRESSGLALSSRNQYLSDAEKAQAPQIYAGLSAAEQLFRQGERQSRKLIGQVESQLATAPKIVLEYVELVDSETLTPLSEVSKTGLLAVAARLGKTRLIDNVLLRTRKPIVAIDGPAGAGKSSVTKMVAQQLGLFYLDTGAMYRSITWLVMNSDVRLTDEPGIAELANQATIEVTETYVKVNDQDVTQAIRTPEVTANVSAIAAQGAVRQVLVRQQQEAAARGGVILEGRDIGTHVFPDAELKIFLTATPAERARRRQKDLERMGQPAEDLAALEQSIAERDAKDSNRLIAPLRKASDAVEVVTDGMTIEQVVAKLVAMYRSVAG
ncbi:bifunctional pantoate--beta-alanine ligase/(d)CMP kinase [Romeriopsis navalis]|uniref:bifunctional pantoate--beta-alanine ligase/(d)CMP kinase n=1 Tax=Romeriopsis navalis TaxID=2992132 RepID=UPI0021F846A0|nr:bifunctional pantoate--beta-alanine ligase/(d)CMP kinase [Romeriopsis navalis]